MTAELVVFIAGHRAGLAFQPVAEHRQVMFRYDNAYISDPASTPLSLRLPVEAGEREISHWLDGLLPDNRDVRKEWAEEQKAGGLDPMSMLATPLGLDCAGAVQFCPPGEEGVIAERGAGVEWHTDAEIADWVRKAKQGQRARLGSQTRYSLGGWQTKIALYHADGRWGTPIGDLPTTFILKPGIDPRPGRPFTDSDLMEHVSMAAASELGMEAATTRVERFGSERVLAVERYDRARSDSGWQRSHQEDLCQALDRPPDRKYQNQGGPTPHEIVELLRGQSSAGETDVARFVDALIFNWAIAGIDAHAKNYSLLLERGAVSLAPLYDIMSYLPYRKGQAVPDIITAMMVATDYTLRSADSVGAWERAAQQFSLDQDEVATRAENIMRRCPDAFDAVIDRLDPLDRSSPGIATLSNELRQRSDDVLGAFRGASQPPPSTSPPAGHMPAPPPAAPPQTQTTQTQTTPRALSSVICGAPTGLGRSCQRMLLSVPCPKHPNSSGSRRIKSRRKRS